MRSGAALLFGVEPDRAEHALPALVVDAPATQEHADTPRHRYASRADFAGDALLLILIAVNVARTLRHAMWRDELQIFQSTTSNGSLWELFRHLKYEARGSLWDVMVWLLTRFTADPASMQVLHATLAIGVWIVIYRWSPFTRTEKFLLLLSYFFFWEYFVISRNYVLVALLGLGFVAIRHHRPAQVIVAWLLLGLLANIVVHATIWSVALAVTFALEERRRDTAFLTGAALYLCCLAFGIATMIPAADYGPWGNDVRFDLARLDSVLAIPLGAFVPFNSESVKGAVAFAIGATTAAPRFWNLNPLPDIVALTQAGVDHPLPLVVIFAAPVAACWLIARCRVLEFTVVYVGILSFATLWDYPGASRHHGIVFLALIAGAWAARARSGKVEGSAWALGAVLLVSAFAGVLTLSSELRPFSQSRNAASWLKQSNLSGAFLIGSRDAQVSSIAGYLGRPIYYLECECFGTFIMWNHARQSLLSAEQFRTRLTRAFDLAEGREAILIRNRPLLADELAPNAAGLSAAPLQSFVGAETDESYWIYRMTKPKP